MGMMAVSSTIVFAPKREDLLDQRPRHRHYPRATPEAALCRWVYLAQSRRRGLFRPPREIDVDAIDFRRFRRIARAMKIEGPLENWLANVQDLNGERQVTPGLGL